MAGIGMVPAAAIAADAVEFDLRAIPALQRYVDLLEHPGYIGVVLQNAGLSTGQSKLKLGPEGRTAEVRNAQVRYLNKNGTVYNYEAGYLTGVGDTKITFPVAVDVAPLAAGKIKVKVNLPLSSLLPGDIRERIKLKAQVLGDTGAQQKVLKYLQGVSAESNLAEAILLDAYNRSGGPAVPGRDAGDAVPLSDQSMLILTLLIWFVVVPVVLVIRRVRQRRANAA
jgi:hypothetical protein